MLVISARSLRLACLKPQPKKKGQQSAKLSLPCRVTTATAAAKSKQVATILRPIPRLHPVRTVAATRAALNAAPSLAPALALQVTDQHWALQRMLLRDLNYQQLPIDQLSPLHHLPPNH